MRILNYFKEYSFLFGFLLLAVVLSLLNPKGVIQSLQNINVRYFSIAVFLVLPMFIVKTLCWNYIQRCQGIRYTLKNSFVMYLAGQFIGLVTPARLGEIAKSFYLKKDGWPLGRALVSSILDRITDLAFLLFYAWMGIIFFVPFFQKEISLLLAFSCLPLVMILVSKRFAFLKALLKRAFYFLVPVKYQKSWRISFRDFIEDLKIYQLREYLFMFLITGIAWLIYYLAIFFLARALNLEIPFLYLSFAVTIAGLVTLLPISVSGIGTRESILIILFSPLAISPEKTFAFAYLILSLTIFTALVGFVCWLIKPLRA